MKKILLITLLSNTLLLTACGNTKQATVNNSVNNTPIENNNSDKPKKESEKATRKNPAKMNETITAVGEIYGVPIECEITLFNLQRGEEAYNRAIAENQFNEISADEEVIFFDVTYKLLDYKPEDDSPIYVSTMDFDYFKNDFAQYISDNSIAHDNSLGAEIYENGEVTATVAKVIPKDDNGYLKFDDSLWFTIK